VSQSCDIAGGAVLGLLALCALPPALAADADVIAINVLIEPSEALVDKAIAINQRLRAQAPEGFALDAAHVPHLTVLQRYVRRSELDKAITAVADVVSCSAALRETLMATGIYGSTFAGTGMANFRVAPTPVLLGLHEQLIAALAPYVAASGGVGAFVPEAGGPVNESTVAYVRDFVPQSSGGNYRPHVTVGIGEPAAIEKLVAAPFMPVRFTVKAVSIYQLGNFGTARRRLWSTAGN
jgi:hypothetical protein